MKFSNLLASTLILGSLVTGELALAKPHVSRAEAVKAADFDDNTRLDKKEAKALKAKHPQMYDNLMGFCKAAKADPESMGVKMPHDPTRKQRQCKKKHIARPYLNAWIEQDPKGE